VTYRTETGRGAMRVYADLYLCNVNSFDAAICTGKYTAGVHSAGFPDTQTMIDAQPRPGLTQHNTEKGTTDSARDCSSAEPAINWTLDCRASRTF